MHLICCESHSYTLSYRSPHEFDNTNRLCDNQSRNITCIGGLIHEKKAYTTDRHDCNHNRDVRGMRGGRQGLTLRYPAQDARAERTDSHGNGPDVFLGVLVVDFEIACVVSLKFVAHLLQTVTE